MRLVTSDAMRQLERAAAAGGLSYDTMMENAGRAVAQAIQERAGASRGPVLVLVGPGNNGGDGLVVARWLHLWGYATDVYIWKRDQADDPNLLRARQVGVPVFYCADDPDWQALDERLQRAQVVVDALLGTGVSGPLRGNLPQLLARVRQERAARYSRPVEPLQSPTATRPRRQARGELLVVAVDVPSGLDCDSGQIDAGALPADLTVTFACPKRGQFLFPGADWVGELLVADIGIPAELAQALPAVELVTAESVASGLPPRPRDANKGTFGKVLIVAGSPNYVGAPCLSALAAYRVGAGLVTLAVSEEVYRVIAPQLTEPTFLIVPGDMGALVPAALRVLDERWGTFDALLVGPGLGRESCTGDFLWELLSPRKRKDAQAIGFTVDAAAPAQAIRLPPCVIDADGLNLLAEHERWWQHVPPGSVLTPHPGEMARLLGTDIASVQADRIATAQRAAAEWGCVVVLKGAYTVVAEPQGAVSVLPFAVPLLASAGTGDVLAGAITGLLAQGLDAYSAAVCGAFLHGLAGELVSRELGTAGLLAGELLAWLPQARRAVLAT